jgi:hypothetical protein
VNADLHRATLAWLRDHANDPHPEPEEYADARGVRASGMNVEARSSQLVQGYLTAVIEMEGTGK